jgi:hypothetical protein
MRRCVVNHLVMASSGRPFAASRRILDDASFCKSVVKDEMAAHSPLSCPILAKMCAHTFPICPSRDRACLHILCPVLTWDDLTHPSPGPIP